MPSTEGNGIRNGSSSSSFSIIDLLKFFLNLLT
jgi:hypothetical protein